MSVVDDDDDDDDVCAREGKDYSRFKVGCLGDSRWVTAKRVEPWIALARSKVFPVVSCAPV